MSTENPYPPPSGNAPGHQAPYDPETEEHTAPLAWDRVDVTDEGPPRSQLSVGYLVTGLVFLGIAGLWLAREVGAVEVADLDLLLPLLLVVVGAAGLIAGLARATRRR